MTEQPVLYDSVYTRHFVHDPTSAGVSGRLAETEKNLIKLGRVDKGPPFAVRQCGNADFKTTYDVDFVRPVELDRVAVELAVGGLLPKKLLTLRKGENIGKLNLRREAPVRYNPAIPRRTVKIGHKKKPPPVVAAVVEEEEEEEAETNDGSTVPPTPPPIPQISRMQEYLKSYEAPAPSVMDRLHSATASNSPSLERGRKKASIPTTRRRRSLFMITEEDDDGTPPPPRGRKPPPRNPFQTNPITYTPLGPLRCPLPAVSHTMASIVSHEHRAARDCPAYQRNPLKNPRTVEYQAALSSMSIAAMHERGRRPVIVMR